jgi:hypothetical protein
MPRSGTSTTRYSGPVSTLTLKWDQVLAWRMARQDLVDPTTDNPADVGRRLCGCRLRLPQQQS